MTVTIHTGGPSIAGSNPINADVVLEARPTSSATSTAGRPPMSTGGDRATGGDRHGARDRAVRQRADRAAHAAARATRARARSPRSSATTRPPAPASSRSACCGTLSLLASLGDLAPAEAIACATGNTARVYRLNRGLIAEGREADLVVCDAPIGSVGGDALGRADRRRPAWHLDGAGGRQAAGRPQPQHAAGRRARPRCVKGQGPGGGGH